MDHTPQLPLFITVIDFLSQYPQYELKHGIPVVDQPRIYSGVALEMLPTELLPSFPARVGNGGKGRSRWNFNNTLTHNQCKICNRIKRNDNYHNGKNFRQYNRIFPYCKECNGTLNANRYDARADQLAALRQAIWRYLAPSCAACGYDKHPVAMDMHHLRDKEDLIANLVTNFVAGMNPEKGKALIREAHKCVSLCANCHRLVHAGVVVLPPNYEKTHYNLADLMTIVKRQKVNRTSI